MTFGNEPIKILCVFVNTENKSKKKGGARNFLIFSSLSLDLHFHIEQQAVA